MKGAESRQPVGEAARGPDPIWGRSLAGFYRANEGENLLIRCGGDRGEGGDKAGNGKCRFYGACKT